MYSHYEDIYEDLIEQIGSWKTETLAQRLTDEDVPFGVVLDPDDILLDPQVETQHIIKTFEDSVAGDMRHVNRSSRFSNTITGIRFQAPRLGEHGNQILKELGYKDSEIQPLLSRGVVL